METSLKAFKNNIQNAIQFFEEVITSVKRESMNGDEYVKLESLCYDFENNETINFLQDFIPEDILYKINFENHVYPSSIIDPSGKDVWKDDDECSTFDILHEDNRKEYTFKIWDKEKQPIIDEINIYIEYLNSRLVVNFKSDKNMFITKTHLNGYTVSHEFDTEGDEYTMYADRIIPSLFSLKLIGKDSTLLSNIKNDHDRKVIASIREELLDSTDEELVNRAINIISHEMVRVCCIPVYVEPYMMVIMNDKVLNEEQMKRLKTDILLTIDAEYSYKEYTIVEMEEEIVSGKLEDLWN